MRIHRLAGFLGNSPSFLVASTLTALTALAGGASAATLNVNIAGDLVRPGDGCTFREALQAANNNVKNAECSSSTPSGADTISIAAGLRIVLTSQATVEESLTIRSSSTNQLATLVGEPSQYTLYFLGKGTGATLRIEDIALTHDNGTMNGANGLFVDASHKAILNRVVVRNNDIGIEINDGPSGSAMTLLDCTQCAVTANSNEDPNTPGGGIVSHGPNTKIDLKRSAVYNNSSASEGAGITNRGVAVITNSTISGNYAEWLAAGILQAGASLTLASSTVTRNTTGGCQGAAITRYNLNPITYNNAIVYGNQDGCECENIYYDSAFPSAFRSSYSIVSSSCLPAEHAGTRDLIDVNPNLASAASTSYPSLVGYKPNAGPARDHGPTSGGPTVDEFNRSRNTGGGGIDTGALER
jgi:hypothetical protein